MDGNEKVKVVSNTNGNVLVKLASRNFMREWPRKDSFVMIPFEVLEEGMYDNGFRYMIEHDMLIIDNLQACIDLGLEPDTAEKIENHVIMTDADIEAMLITNTAKEFEKKLEEMPQEMRMQVAHQAIKLKIRDGAKIAAIKKYALIDVNEGISLAQQMEV